MDKQQNELVKSYFRARKNAINTGETELKPYEVTEKTIPVFKDILDNLNERNLSFILVKKPDLISHFEDRLGDMNGERISNILMEQPKLISYFKNRLNEIDVRNVYLILKQQPQLISYFENRVNELLEKMAQRALERLIISHPQLKKYFYDNPFQ